MPQEMTPEDEFEKAFAEQGAKPAEADARTEPAAEAAKPKDEQQPADKPAAESAPADAAAAAPADGAPAQEPQGGAADPNTDMRRQLADSQHRERSSAARVSHFMRQSNQQAEQIRSLQAEIATLKAAKPAASPVAPVASDDDLKDVLADAPELRQAVERRVSKAVTAVQAKLDTAMTQLAEVGKKVDSAARSVEPLVSREEQRQELAVHDALDQRFTGWRDTVKSPDFKDWLQAQPKAVQTMYLHGATFDEAGTVLTLFQASKGAPKTEAAAPASQPGASDKQQRLREAAGIAPRSSAPVSTRKDDFDSAFAEAVSSQTKR